MLVLHSIPKIDSVITQKGCALTIGNFDGVHKGHQALLSDLRRKAEGLTCCVMTFDPHPKIFFAQQRGIKDCVLPRVNSMRDKLLQLLKCNVDGVIVARFNQDLASMEPADFIEQILHKRLNARYILVGRDFCFGKGRRGNFDLLKEIGSQYGMTVEAIDDVTDPDSARYSSTRLRELLSGGKIEEVNEYLGRPYTISGRVVHGKKLGRKIGVPTINIPVSKDVAIHLGVYTVRTTGLSDKPIPGIANIGLRPTTDSGNNVLLEVNLFDVDIDAYGKPVCVEFLQFLREEKKFPSLETMISVMRDDISSARKYFEVNGL